MIIFMSFRLCVCHRKARQSFLPLGLWPSDQILAKQYLLLLPHTWWILIRFSTTDFVVLILLTYFVEKNHTHFLCLGDDIWRNAFLSNWLEVEVGQSHDAKQLHLINVARLCVSKKKQSVCFSFNIFFWSTKHIKSRIGGIKAELFSGNNFKKKLKVSILSSWSACLLWLEIDLGFTVAQVIMHIILPLSDPKMLPKKKFSDTGNWTRATWVRARYPNH